MLIPADKEHPTSGFLCTRCLDECETPHTEVEPAWQYAAALGWSRSMDDDEQAHFCDLCTSADSKETGRRAHAVV